MKRRTNLAVLGLVLLSCSTGEAYEPVVGGPCEGCELVFVGMPEQLSARSRIAPPEQPGEALRIEGTVRAHDGTPAAGIIVYAYHTDSAGIYPRGSVRHGRLRGWARTDSAGYYQFETIRPGAYPNGNIPQHIHMHVIEPSRATYWIDDINFADDPLWTDAMAERVRSPRAGAGVCQPSRDPDGTWLVRRDIALGENVPGYQTPSARPDSATTRSSGD